MRISYALTERNIKSTIKFKDVKIKVWDKIQK